MYLDIPYTLTRSDADLYVEQVGPEDGPVIFYLHGGPGYNSHSFRDLIGEDLDRYRMIYADQRGSGRSYASADFTINDLADDTQTTLDTLEIESASLLAHGFGAQIAIRAAGTFPTRISGLILVSPWFSMPLLTRTLPAPSGNPERSGRTGVATRGGLGRNRGSRSGRGNRPGIRMG